MNRGALLTPVAIALLATSCSSTGHPDGAGKSFTKAMQTTRVDTGIPGGPATCPTGGPDWIEFDHYPPEPDAATDDSGYFWVASEQRCVTAPEWVDLTKPFDAPKACTYLAHASDNPGYDVDAIPAAPLEKVQYRFGEGC